jgi:hypothetical protein
MTAGGGTTVYAMSHTVYYVLSHPEVLLRLNEELKESEQYIRKKDWRYIENLPYLVSPHIHILTTYLNLDRGPLSKRHCGFVLPSLVSCPRLCPVQG